MLSTSENDHEALAAIRKANFLLRKNNLTWTNFFKAVPKTYTPPPQQAGFGSQDTRVGDIEEMLSYCMQYAGPKVIKFIESLNDFFDGKGYLTDKQVDGLENVYRNTKAYREGRGL